MPELNDPPNPNASQTKDSAIFAYPFRIFFISIAGWALIIVPLWLTIVTGIFDLPLSVAPLNWHRHEMLFGLLNPAIAGFLLTAVCVWTNTDRLHGRSLCALWLVWLTGRLSMAFGEALPLSLVIGINLAFLLLVMIDAGWRIKHAKQSKQFIILVLLGVLWAMEAALLVTEEVRYVNASLAMTMLLMLVIGGRITPAFSINWLKQHGNTNPPVATNTLLEKIIIASMSALLIAVLTGNASATSLCSLFATVVILLRLILWRGWLVRNEPLLWILHLSLLWIPIGLVLMTLGELHFLPKTIWQHAIGIGAMSGLIFGVMTRVSLGHTGRTLQLPQGIVAAYWLIQGAVILRISTALNMLPWTIGLSLSTICWVLAFGIFLWRYTPILIRPRVDGRPG